MIRDQQSLLAMKGLESHFKGLDSLLREDLESFYHIYALETNLGSGVDEVTLIQGGRRDQVGECCSEEKDNVKRVTHICGIAMCQNQ